MIYIQEREEEIGLEVTIVIYSEKNGAMESEQGPTRIFCVVFAAIYRVFDSSIKWSIAISTDWRRRNRASGQLLISDVAMGQIYSHSGGL